MDPLAHALPPASHPVTHSCVAYPQGVAYSSDYHKEYRTSSGAANPKIQMGEYYLPNNGINTPYHRTQLPFPIYPPSSRPPLPYSGDPTGKHPNLRPTSSSSLESDPRSQDEGELLNAHPSAYPSEYGHANTPCASRPYASTTSSENEEPRCQEAPSRRYRGTEDRAGSNGLQELVLSSFNNQSTPDSRYSADEPLIRQEDYAQDLTKADVKSELSESERSPQPKSATGKKPSSVKVSEKRRQQNRAAQRAMRERRKRAAQHQEVHMSAILTENVMLREKVAYLSNILLSHAINPGAHPSWTPLQPQDHLPPVLPPLHAGNPPVRLALVADPTSSASISANSAAGHSTFPPVSLACSSAFPLTHGPMLSYYPPGPFGLEYPQQGNGTTGIRNLSGPSSTSNLARPGTAEQELTVGSRTATFSRWQNSTASEGVSFQGENSIAATMGQFGLIGSVTADSGSTNTASTFPSPTETDGQLVDAMPTNL